MSRIAEYRTRRGAEKYAEEIRAKFPDARTETRNLGLASGGFFGWNVLVQIPGGKAGWALRRPRNYDRFGKAHSLPVGKD